MAYATNGDVNSALLSCTVPLTELEWPAGEEALSDFAVHAIERVLTLQVEQRPGAQGKFLLSENPKIEICSSSLTILLWSRSTEGKVRFLVWKGSFLRY